MLNKIIYYSLHNRLVILVIADDLGYVHGV